MRTNWLKRAVWIVGLLLVLGGLAWFAWPRPIPVDLATVTRGKMAVTIDDEGKTRVRHIYTVSAPIAGKVLRISHPSGDARNFPACRRSRYGGRDRGRGHAADDAGLHRCPLPRRTRGRRRVCRCGGEAGGSRHPQAPGGARLLSQRTSASADARAHANDFGTGLRQGKIRGSKPTKPR